MAVYQILYWRDLPAQIRVFVNGRARSCKLPDRFQAEIDRVAMRDGLSGTDAYLEQWRWTEKLEREGEPEEVAKALVVELAAGWWDEQTGREMGR